MKRFVWLLLMFSFVSADYQLSANVSCNRPGNIRVSGIPEDACIAYSQSIATGINAQDGIYFFDLSDITVSVSSDKFVNLRFLVPPSSIAYNQIQALTQTALASGATISLIFSNPNLSSANCYRYADVGNLVCPLLSIEIVK